MKYTMQQQLMQRKNLAYSRMKELREKARIARIEFDMVSRDLENHKVELTIQKLSK